MSLEGHEMAEWKENTPTTIEIELPCVSRRICSSMLLSKLVVHQLGHVESRRQIGADEPLVAGLTSKLTNHLIMAM